MASQVDLAHRRSTRQARMRQREKVYEETPHTLRFPQLETSVPSISRGDIFTDGQAFVLYGVLSDAECADFVAQGEALGFKDSGYPANYRVTDRVSAHSECVAGHLFDRCSTHFAPFHRFGEWRPSTLNPVFRLCRYFEGGFFLSHTAMVASTRVSTTVAARRS